MVHINVTFCKHLVCEIVKISSTQSAHQLFHEEVEKHFSFYNQYYLPSVKIKFVRGKNIYPNQETLPAQQTENKVV